MDSMPFHILQPRVPEPGMSFTYRELLCMMIEFYIDGMFFVFNYFRGVNH
jgi:hypothetical protein